LEASGVTNHRYDQPMTPVATPRTIIHSMLFPIRKMLPPLHALAAFVVPTPPNCYRPSY
jgi:hypothetical protein